MKRNHSALLLNLIQTRTDCLEGTAHLSPMTSFCSIIGPILPSHRPKVLVRFLHLARLSLDFSLPDPSLVFSELMGEIKHILFDCYERPHIWLLGVIKGAEQTLTSTNRFLDQHAYEALSPRTQPAFASQRNAIYTIFEMYLSLKRDRGDFDAADRLA